MRTTVIVPDGVQTGLEDALEEAYGLREAVVVEALDTTDDGDPSTWVWPRPPTWR